MTLSTMKVDMPTELHNITFVGCSDKCKLNCCNNFDESAKERILYEFISLENKAMQRQYIMEHTDLSTPKQRRRNSKSHRNFVSSFYFDLNGRRVRVCKDFFKTTLNLTDRKIRTALDKKKNFIKNIRTNLSEYDDSFNSSLQVECILKEDDENQAGVSVKIEKPDETENLDEIPVMLQHVKTEIDIDEDSC